MSLIRILSSALILATLQSSHGAVLRGRRPETESGPVTTPLHIIDHSVHPATSPDDKVDKVFQGLTDMLQGLDRRQNSNLQVSEEDMRELLDDVNAIEEKLQDWLSNGGSNQPDVSEPPLGPLTSSTAGPWPTDTPNTSGTVSATGCMITVTETVYEYVYEESASVIAEVSSANDEIKSSAASAPVATAKSESLQGPSASSTVAPPQVTTNSQAPDGEGVGEGAGILWQTIALPSGAG